MVEKKDGQKKQIDQQLYINYMQIKPIKMTISVSLERGQDEEIQTGVIGILRFIPFGIDNAILQIDSFLSYHIFYDSKQITENLKSYYYSEARKQILLNAGSYDILAPIQLVKGLGMGMKNIFYDPFYEFVKKKEIQALSETCF